MRRAYRKCTQLRSASSRCKYRGWDGQKKQHRPREKRDWIYVQIFSFIIRANKPDQIFYHRDHFRTLTRGDILTDCVDVSPCNPRCLEISDDAPRAGNFWQNKIIDDVSCLHSLANRRESVPHVDFDIQRPPRFVASSLNPRLWGYPEQLLNPCSGC